MKKLITLVIVTLIVTTGVYGQDTLKLKHFNTWAISPYLSVPFQNTDIEPVSLETKLTGVGLNVEKHLSHYTSFQLGVFNTTMYLVEGNQKYKIGLTQYDSRFYFHITNGHILRNWRNTQIYGYGGLGRVYYNSSVSTDGSTYTDLSKGGSYVLLAGGGAKYRVGNKTSLFIDASYNHTTTDKLDGTRARYSDNDGYYRLSVGVSYTLGKKRMIEWDNYYKYLVPEEVHDTTVVIKKIEYVAPKVEPVLVDSAVIYFTPGSSSIEYPYLETLDKLVQRAVNNGYSLEIESYCDAKGTPKTNLKVISERAENVKKYILTSIPESKIIISAHDESFALYVPDARNRKVVVKIVK
jgi:outer membrane protein OmpA-like peptidoglycan-associated protein